MLVFRWPNDPNRDLAIVWGRFGIRVRVKLLVVVIVIGPCICGGSENPRIL